MTLEHQRRHIEAELERAKNALRAAQELHKLGLYSDAVSRAYYAALHYAVALLLTEGVEPKTHGGVSTMLGFVFTEDGARDEISVAEGFCKVAAGILSSGGW